MRSSKQRQRNKQNRQTRPSGGNVVNRVFDSSGPEGKVRGTPAQIIEKYLQLHRDAQLAGDRVNAENFAQHAEHYTRMLAEAQREIDRAREEQDQWHRDRQAERDRQMEQSRDRQGVGQSMGQGGDVRGEPRHDGPRSEAQRIDGSRPDVPRDGSRVDGQRHDARADGRPFEPRDRDRERQSRFRAQEEAAQVAAPPAFDAFGSNDRPDEPAAEAADASFLRQPLFPVIVADDEGDASGPALVELPEDRQDRQPRPAAAVEPRPQARRGRPRREEPRPEADATPAAVPALAPLEVAAAEDGEPARAPRARRPRRPRAAAVAPDAAE